MLLIIVGTNRKGSRTTELANAYKSILQSMTDEEVQLISIADLQEDIMHAEMYESDRQGELLVKAQDKYFIPAKKWIVITPEYNGSYPGAIKLLLDAISVRDAENTFHNKKVALVGLSSGRTGNWLGMNHLTAVLNYLKMDVYHNKLAISHISTIIDEEGVLHHEKTIAFIRKQIKNFLSF